MIFDIHIFICTNQSTGNEKLSCGETHGVKKEDVKEIICSHIINHTPLERLLLKEW